MALRSLALASLPTRVAAFLGHVIGPRSPCQGALQPEGSVHEARKSVAATYLRGTGIEIGALHQPLPVTAGATVQYVDRMSAADLRRQYVELADVPLVDVDIIDDGETLRTIQEATQDFVIANHFVEHCQDPIGALQNFFRVLKAGGILYMAVPDKRFTFDVDRACTTIDHLMRDFTEGPAWSKRQHFEEWSRLVNKREEDRVDEEVRHLMNINYSIHYHVWGAPELLELVSTLKGLVKFELELFLRNGPENLLIMRKAA